MFFYLEVERSVLGDDPSRTRICFFILGRGAHRAGGGKIRLGPGNICLLGKRRSLGWRWKDPSRGTIRRSKRKFLFSGEALTWLEVERSRTWECKSPGWRWKDPSRGMIRLMVSQVEALTGLEVERSVSGDDPSRSMIYCYFQERRSPCWRWKDPSRTWEYKSLRWWRSPGWGDDPSRTRIYSYPQERRSPGWRWKDPSRTWGI